MCDYCDNGKVLLKGKIDKFNDICLFGLKDEDVIRVRELKAYFEEERIRVFYDRGYIRLTVGDDIGCLDHSEDKIKINYCPMCGRSLIL